MGIEEILGGGSQVEESEVVADKKWFHGLLKQAKVREDKYNACAVETDTLNKMFSGVRVGEFFNIPENFPDPIYQATIHSPDGQHFAILCEKLGNPFGDTDWFVKDIKPVPTINV